jgi:hypothetical protein
MPGLVTVNGMRAGRGLAGGSSHLTLTKPREPSRAAVHHAALNVLLAGLVADSEQSWLASRLRFVIAVLGSATWVVSKPGLGMRYFYASLLLIAGGGAGTCSAVRQAVA